MNSAGFARCALQIESIHEGRRAFFNRIASSEHRICVIHINLYGAQTKRTLLYSCFSSEFWNNADYISKITDAINCRIAVSPCIWSLKRMDGWALRKRNRIVIGYRVKPNEIRERKPFLEANFELELHQRPIDERHNFFPNLPDVLENAVWRLSTRYWAKYYHLRTHDAHSYSHTYGILSLYFSV